MKKERLLTIMEAAGVLEVSTKTVRRYIKKRKLTRIRRKGRVYVDSEQVFALRADDEVTISYAAAGRKLGLGVHYVRELVTKGELRRVGKHVAKDSVDEYIARKAYQKEAAAEDRKAVEEVFEHANWQAHGEKHRQKRGAGGKYTANPRVVEPEDEQTARAKERAKVNDPNRTYRTDGELGLLKVLGDERTARYAEQQKLADLEEAVARRKRKLPKKEQREEFRQIVAIAYTQMGFTDFPLPYDEGE